MSLEIELQIVSYVKTLPHPTEIKRWAIETLKSQKIITAELTIRIVDIQEITYLNNKFRNINKDTNVLAFPYMPIPGISSNALGDIIICAAVVEKEARDQKKTFLAHWAHMVTHGILHLLGFDHIKEKDAAIMEQLEINLLKKLGFNNPYEDS